MWEDFKSLVTHMLSGLLISIVAFLLIYSIAKGWQPRKEIIDGHEYIVIPEMEGVEMEHSPECDKCREDER